MFIFAHFSYFYIFLYSLNFRNLSLGSKNVISIKISIKYQNIRKGLNIISG